MVRRPDRQRLAALLLLPLGACVHSAPVLADDPAEALAALEQRLRTAEHVTFAANAAEPTDEPDDGFALAGTVALGPQRRLRIVTTGTVNGLAAAPSLVADGAVLFGGRNGLETRFPDFSGETAPPSLRADFAGSFLRWGLDRTLLQLVSGIVPPGYRETEAGLVAGDPAAQAPFRDAAWGTPEVIEGRAARPLPFSVAFGTQAATVTLWLDAETGLPVRRTDRVETRFPGSENTYIAETAETYTGWSFEPAPPDTFALPDAE